MNGCTMGASFRCMATEGGVMMSQWKHQGAVLDPARNRAEGLWTLADLGELSVGERIKTLREERDWTAKRLADECELAGAPSLTRSAIAKVEAGLRRLRPEEAVTLARVFGVPTDALLGVSRDGRPEAREHGSAEHPPPSKIGRPDDPEDTVTDSGRGTELDLLMGGLRSPSGPHFWLVIGPPGIGKTALASQLAHEAEKPDKGWATRLLDVRAQEPAARANAEVLISRMFGLDAPRLGERADDKWTFGETWARTIAQQISKAGKSLLCVVDSADELTDDTSKRLRSGFSAVYSQMQKTGKPGIRLAFVIASRLEDGWRGVTPVPKPEVLALPGLRVDVVERRLRKAAGSAREGSYSAGEFADMAALVHGVTAGLPPLLDPFLSWVGDEEWLDISRLEEADVFESLAGPYIHDALLAPESLFPRAVNVPPEQLAVIRSAVRYLVRYRLFTRSHVWDHMARDTEFRESLKSVGWTTEDLWGMLSGMALLKKPLDELWQEFHPAIRRLLFRYSYPSDEQRAAAHKSAQAFVVKWSDEQPPKEQVIGRIEGLWHAVSALRLSGAADIREQLITAARQAGAGLGESEIYTLSDLGAYAADRIARDAELLAALAHTDGLAAELNNVVMAWT
jgi:transcriptional regulator with XRE-family HTH domain